MLQLTIMLAAAAVAAAAAPTTWVKMGRSEGAEFVSFSAALKQRNTDALEQVFDAVSDPLGKYYAAYPSVETLNELTRPKSEDVHTVRKWLESSGASCEVRPSSLACRAPVAAVEKMLSTELTAFSHPVTGDIIHRIEESNTYSFPEHVGDKVKFLTGLKGFPVEHYGRVKAVEAGSPYVVPSTISSFYGLGSASGNTQVSQAAAEFQNYPAYAESDLTTFISNTGIPSFTIPTAHKIGPFNGNSPQPESTLDVQYIGATGVGNSNWYITEAQWMYDFSEALLAGTTKYPDIISMSYGWYEGDQCQISPSSKPCAAGGSADFVSTVNANFAKAGAAGFTLFASSGDSGAHGRTDPTCSSPITRPAYPAASPYVTAVGATMVETSTIKTGGSAPICSSASCISGGTEIVASNAQGALITSGGGFSNVAPTPKWAKAVQDAYMKDSSAVPPAGDFNSSGRGYPDVSALGHSYYIELDGQEYSVDGTSCSSPVWAGVAGLLQAYQISKGRGKLGALNPTIYQIGAAHPEAFNDITSGNNKCTESSCSCTTGFSAVKGWDAVSGFGTPNFPNLKAALDAQAAYRAARF